MDTWSVDQGPWRALKRAAMLRFGLPFIAGIAAARAWHLDFMLVLAAWVPITVGVGWFLWRRTERPDRWQRGAVAMCWFLVTGLTVQTGAHPEADRAHFMHDPDLNGPWLVEVDAINGSSGSTVRLDASVRGRLAEDGAPRRTGAIMLTLLPRDTAQVLRPGDLLLVDAPLDVIDRIADPGGFDRGAWAASKGIAHEAFAGADEWTFLTHRPHWTDPFASARGRVDAWLRASGLADRERGLVKALVLGLRDEVDRDQNTAFVRSGTIHVLAVSGMHVGLIYVLIAGALRWWGASTLARWARTFTVLFVLWYYAGLTGGTPSVMRATVMFTLFSLAQLRDRRPDQLNSLFAAGFLLLVWDPGMLVQASFQLSFLAVLGILLFLEPFQRLWSPRTWLMEQVWSLVAVSLAAQVFTTPVSILLFHAFPVWFLPANLVIVTLMTLAVYLSIALLVLHAVPVVGGAIAAVLSALLGFVGATADLFAWLPGAYPAIRLGGFGAVLLYGIILMAGAWWAWRWRWAAWGVTAMVALLLVAWVRQARTTQEQRSFVVYDDRKELQAALISGRSMTVFGPDTTSTFLLAKLDRHMRAGGVERRTLVGLDAVHDPKVDRDAVSAWGGAVCMNDDITVAFLRGDLRPPIAMAEPVDVLVLHDIERADTAVLSTVADRLAQVVVAGGTRWRHRAQLRDWGKAHAIPVHAVQDDGTFILRDDR